MEKNRIETVKIDNLGMNGEGVARVNNEVVFVPFALTNETVTCQCINNKNKFSIMKVNKIITKSDDRVTPKCPYFKKCGGCDLQHLSYQKQLEFKTNLVKETMQKVGNIDIDVKSCEPSSLVYNYRNKASFPIEKTTSGYEIGMYRVNSHNLVNIDYCYLQKQDINTLLKIFIKWLHKVNMYLDLVNTSFDEKQQNLLKTAYLRQNETKYQSSFDKNSNIKTTENNSQQVKNNKTKNLNSRSVTITSKNKQEYLTNDKNIQNTIFENKPQQITTNSDEISNSTTQSLQNTTKFDILKHLVVRSIDDKLLITLVATGENIPLLYDLVSEIKNEFNDFGLNININNLNNNVILSNKYKHIYGNEKLKINSKGVNLEITNASFYQVNDYIKDKIYDEVLSQIDNKIVVDAFSGAGLLTSMLAKKAKKVYGIEIVKSAVLSANELMKNNNIKNVENICGDCTIELPKLIKKLKDEVTIVLDPPRKGCDKKILEAIKTASCDKIIYIACSPISLARDCKILLENNDYQITLVKPFDMFPETKNVETLCVLEKVSE